MSAVHEKKVEDFRALDAILYIAPSDRIMPICLPMPCEALIFEKWLHKGEMVICADTLLVRNPAELKIISRTRLRFTPDEPGDYPRWATELQWGSAYQPLPAGDVRLAVCITGDHHKDGPRAFVWLLDQMLPHREDECAVHRYIREYLQRRRCHVGTINILSA